MRGTHIPTYAVDLNSLFRRLIEKLKNNVGSERYLINSGVQWLLWKWTGRYKNLNLKLQCGCDGMSYLFSYSLSDRNCYLSRGCRNALSNAQWSGAKANHTYSRSATNYPVNPLESSPVHYRTTNIHTWNNRFDVAQWRCHFAVGTNDKKHGSLNFQAPWTN